MILIAHRGNINGPNSKYENSMPYILEAINKGYDVEIDVWAFDTAFYLGHDNPRYRVDYIDLCKLFNNAWFHCKNIEAMLTLVRGNTFYNHSLRFFWHQNDDIALTSNDLLWTYPGKELTPLSIAVMPETVNYTNKELSICYGICSDYVESFKGYL